MNVFFTSYDGTVWVNKAHIKKFIRNTLYDAPPSRCQYSKQRLADTIIKYLDTLYYKEESGDIQVESKDVDYFYCGNCRKGFPFKYYPGMIKTNSMPCPVCGAQSMVTSKPDEEENVDEENNTESS